MGSTFEVDAYLEGILSLVLELSLSKVSLQIFTLIERFYYGWIFLPRLENESSLVKFS